MAFAVAGMSSSTAINMGIVIICVNVGILTHSHFLNKGKKKRSFVCLSTEACAASSILGAVAVIVTGFFSQNLVITAIFYDLVYNGVFWAITAICDMYMFWERFMVLNKKCPRWKNHALQAYIWITVLMWAPGYSLLPFFCDTNSVSFWNVYGQFYVVAGYLVLLYNLYFTAEFAFALFKAVAKTAATTGVSSSAKRIKYIAIKSIIHCLSSSVWNIVSSYCLGVGSLMFLIFIPFGLHVLFNYKLESFGKQQRTGRSSFECAYSTVHQRGSAQNAIGRNASHEITIVNHTRPRISSCKSYASREMKESHTRPRISSCISSRDMKES